MSNPAITAALIAASRQQEVEEGIERRLKKVKALGPSSAVELDLKAGQQKLLDRAIATGTVRRLEGGRLYLNEQAVADRKEGQVFVLLLVLLILASFGASMLALANTLAD